MPESLYSQSEVNRIFAHIPARTHYRWVQLELVKWAKEHEDGRGVHRLYSLEHLWQIGLVEELMALNISKSGVQEAMKWVHSYNKFWEDCTIVLGNNRVGIREEPDSIKQARQRAFVAGVINVQDWDWCIPVPNKDVGEFIQGILDDTRVVAAINL